MAATIIYGGSVHEVQNAIMGADELVLSNGDLRNATGWEIKPEGICRDEICIPLIGDQAGLVQVKDGEQSLDLTGFARYIKQPYARDEAIGVWYFGAPSSDHESLQNLQAPDFTLPDWHGQPFTMSSTHGKKVFLVLWASWCGCRLDLPIWSALREELKAGNFEVVTVDCDTRGLEVGGQYIEPVNPAHPSLVDQQHLVPELYNTRNVPAAFWIDEQGKIVRANDPIYATRRNRETGETTTNTRYLDGLRDWVARGSESVFVKTAEQAKLQVGEADEAQAQATANFRLGTYLYQQGHQPEAIAQFKLAHELKPDNWNFRRQAYALGDAQQDYGTTVQEFARESGIPSYPALDLPEV